MKNIDPMKIRNIAQWLKMQSVSNNANSESAVSKRDLERLRDNIASAIYSLADIFED